MTLTATRRTELALLIAQLVAIHADFPTLSLDDAHAIAATELDVLTENIEMDDDEADLLWVEAKQAVAALIERRDAPTAPAVPVVADDGARAAKIEDVPAGEFVKRKADATKVYKRSEYIRSEGKYMLRDQDDISRSVLVKKGTIVFIGFTY